MTRIKAVELHEFEFEAVNLGAPTAADTIGAMGYSKGSVMRLPKYAVVIETDDGCRGEYVTHWVGAGSALAQSRMLAPRLIGRHAEEREGIYDDLKRELRQFDHMGHGPLDIALWDWAGKQLGCSVGHLLGAHRQRHRHVMSAMRNSNYYEVALLGPDCPNSIPPVYACGYSDQIDCVGEDGCVPVPKGPGLGVTYDWDFIERNRTRLSVIE